MNRCYTRDAKSPSLGKNWAVLAGRTQILSTMTGCNVKKCRSNYFCDIFCTLLQEMAVNGSSSSSDSGSSLTGQEERLVIELCTQLLEIPEISRHSIVSPGCSSKTGAVNLCSTSDQQRSETIIYSFFTPQTFCVRIKLFSFSVVSVQSPCKKWP